jgi:hypothetical protein
MSGQFEDNKLAHPTHAALKKEQGKDELDWPRIGTASVDANGNAFMYLHRLPEQENLSIALRPLKNLEELRRARIEKPNLHQHHDNRSIKP